MKGRGPRGPSQACAPARPASPLLAPQPPAPPAPPPLAPHALQEPSPDLWVGWAPSEHDIPLAQLARIEVRLQVSLDQLDSRLQRIEQTQQAQQAQQAQQLQAQQLQAQQLQTLLELQVELHAQCLGLLQANQQAQHVQLQTAAVPAAVLAVPAVLEEQQYCQQVQLEEQQLCQQAQQAQQLQPQSHQAQQQMRQQQQENELLTLAPAMHQLYEQQLCEQPAQPQWAQPQQVQQALALQAQMIYDEENAWPDDRQQQQDEHQPQDEPPPQPNGEQPQDEPLPQPNGERRHARKKILPYVARRTLTALVDKLLKDGELSQEENEIFEWLRDQRAEISSQRQQERAAASASSNSGQQRNEQSDGEHPQQKERFCQRCFRRGHWREDCEQPPRLSRSSGQYV